MRNSSRTGNIRHTPQPASLFLNTFLLALLPVILLITLGYALRRIQFIEDDIWTGIERLTYFVLFPALMVNSISQQALDNTPWPAMLGVILLTLFMASLVLVIWHLLLHSHSDSTFTSVFQGGVRFNTYITLAVAQGLCGVEGLAMASIVAGFMVVTINLLSIFAFILWGSGEVRGQFLRQIAFNPLIIGCAIGWTLSLTATTLPTALSDFLEILSRTALPLGLMAVGAALRLKKIGDHRYAIVLSSVVQFVIKPVAVVMLCQAFGLDGLAASAVIIAFIVPTAPSGYILARQLGGDADTMASIITTQTLFAVFAMTILAHFLLP